MREGEPLPRDAVKRRFVGETIEVSFPDSARLVKKPGAPVSFTWRGKIYRIARVVAEWHEHSRFPHGVESWSCPPYAVRSRSAHGSWGVGRVYYRVETDEGMVFELYYDRRPRGQRREGQWVLFARCDVPGDRGTGDESDD